jgi:hypothetical protein
MKTYTVTVTYVGEVEAECASDIEETIWCVLALVGEPFDKYMFEAESIDIDWEDE